MKFLLSSKYFIKEEMKMLNKKREQKLKNQLSFAFRIRRIFLLIPLLLLCLSFVIPTQVHAQTDDSYFLNMWLNTKSLADLKNVYPGHTNIIVATISDPDLSKIPASKVSATSSNPSVLKVIDKYNIDFANYHPNMDIGIEIEAMKAGKATLTIQYKTIVKKLDITVKKSTCFYKRKRRGQCSWVITTSLRDFCNRSMEKNQVIKKN